MGGFLIAPLMPVEFTSILTATVWSFSGKVYALVFVVVGTFFRADSYTIFSGIQSFLTRASPVGAMGLSELATVAIMFAGNVCAAYLFKRVIRQKILRRLPTLYSLV